jgi:tetratricopeptide (TPR) repeat protein
MRYTLAVCLGILLFAPANLGAQELTRDEILEQIENLSTSADPKDIARIRSLADGFLSRFPDDEEARAVQLAGGKAAFDLHDFEGAIERLQGLTDDRSRYLRGLALVARGRHGDAEPELLAAASARPEVAERWYALGEVRERLGDVGGAREALERALRAKPPPSVQRAARADLDDLAKIGAPAPPLADLTPTGTATVVAFMDRERADLEPVDPAVRVVRVVAGWDDPRVKAWHVPALPRVYVVDAHGIVRAAGVRGAAIARAVEAAGGP